MQSSCLFCVRTHTVGLRVVRADLSFPSPLAFSLGFSFHCLWTRARGAAVVRTFRIRFPATSTLPASLSTRNSVGVSIGDGGGWLQPHSLMLSLLPAELPLARCSCTFLSRPRRWRSRFPW